MGNAFQISWNSISTRLAWFVGWHYSGRTKKIKNQKSQNIPIYQFSSLKTDEGVASCSFTLTLVLKNSIILIIFWLFLAILWLFSRSIVTLFSESLIFLKRCSTFVFLRSGESERTWLLLRWERKKLLHHCQIRSWLSASGNNWLKSTISIQREPELVLGPYMLCMKWGDHRCNRAQLLKFWLRRTTKTCGPVM